MDERTNYFTSYRREGFADSDSSLPFRIVGSYEYYRALLRLERLINISTPEQIEVYNKLVADRPEYTFHAGTYAESMTADALDLNKPEDRGKFDERFLQGGLPWMMALARVELGATMSMYGNHHIEHSFSLLPATSIETEALAAILWDDLQAHVVSLAGDPWYAEVTKPNRKPDSWTVACLRRMKLMTDMIKVLDSIGNQQLSAQMQPVYLRLADQTKKILKQIEKADMPAVNSYSVFADLSSSRQFNRIDGTCPAGEVGLGLGSAGSGTTPVAGTPTGTKPENK